MSLIGYIHTIAATLALITGTYVLIVRKGGRAHRRVGYAYALSMVIMLVTAFMIYRLFGGFGMFHVAAVVSSLTLAGGMVPAIRRSSPGWVIRHFSFMYWSVFGLYAAFAGEVFTRLPGSPFYAGVALTTGGVMLAGTLIWRRMKPRWEEQFIGSGKKI